MNQFELRFGAEAVTDLENLFIYIAQRSSFDTADRYLARIERKCLSLSSLPQRGTAIRGRVRGLRSMGFERRVTILFKVGEGRVEILRILYGGRNLGPQLKTL